MKYSVDETMTNLKKHLKIGLENGTVSCEKLYWAYELAIYATKLRSHSLKEIADLEIVDYLGACCEEFWAAKITHQRINTNALTVTLPRDTQPGDKW